MDSKISWQCAVLIGATALVGCAPDESERQGSERDGAAQSRPGDSALSRNESAQPPGNRDTIRPPTTAANPAAPGSAAAPTQPQLMARAEIEPLGEHTVRGVVEFHQAPAGSTGPMSIHVMLMGLEAGPHGMHVHMGSDCMAPGEHLNPQNAPHGPANAASGMRHLGNITADASGMTEEMVRDSLLGSDRSFIGKVVVVHQRQDDLSTQPDGSSGQPVGCGIIEPAGEDVISQAPAPERGV
jgi:Cu-Zn family superoxide dismutase